MNTQEFEPEPRRTWERKNFDLSILEGRDPRTRAEIETDRDLAKSVEQLVCDFHEQAEKMSASQYDTTLIDADKRMVAMMGRVAIEDARTGKKLVNLTYALVGLTFVLLALTGVITWLTFVLVHRQG